jgi:hypothetical protein
MPFDQSTITEVLPPVWDGGAIQLGWTSTAPLGTVFQVYLNRVLAWHGASRWVAIPMPSSQLQIDIGAVGPGEATTDFSAQLPASPSNRVRLAWLGGSYLDPTGNDDVAGFQVFGAKAPGGAIDYTQALAQIRAYPAGILTDGFGLGGFGQGGFGRAASSYQWTTEALGSGTWPFAVVSFDAAGNLGAPSVSSASISAPPRPPATFPDGSRLHSTYNPANHTVTLSWQTSPA